MAKFVPNEFKITVISGFINTTLYAFLINDPSNLIGEGSSMSNAAALEISSAGGYTRKLVTLGTPNINAGVANIQAPQIIWTATANMTFTKICYARNATATLANTQGTLVRVEDVPGNTITLVSGQSFRHTATFEVSGSVAA